VRHNQPVTTTEYRIQPGQSIVSKTDTKGRITYVNPTFVEVSGFSEVELLGKAHNLVRHPAMPPEAFADMWRTLQGGEPWTGLVKNRCKNGDFYWVVANVAPIREHGQITGYMSVRTAPTREQVETASALYRKFTDNDARGLAIVRGRVVRTGLAPDRLLRLRRDAPLGQRLGWLMGGQALLLGALGLAAGDGVWRAVAGAGALATLVAWYGLQRSIVQPLRDAIATVNALAGGDLSHPAPASAAGSGEMGRLQLALRQLTVNLTAIIGDVRDNVSSIEHATRAIAAGNADLASRTEAQAASLEQTAGSLGNIAEAANRNTDSAVRADGMVLAATTVAGHGGQAVERVGATMQEISASSNRIGDIIGLIDGIAFQTNLLALNAAVEAARRRAGPGFCGRGRRGAQPGPTHRRRRPRNHGTDRSLTGPRGPGRAAGRRRRPDDARRGRQGGRCRPDHECDHGREPRAGARNRRRECGHGGTRRNHAAQRCPGRGIGGGVGQRGR
jgi:aerotaxis receptor